jgi:hypothetical protein
VKYLVRHPNGNTTMHQSDAPDAVSAAREILHRQHPGATIASIMATAARGFFRPLRPNGPWLAEATFIERIEPTE